MKNFIFFSKILVLSFHTLCVRTARGQLHTEISTMQKRNKFGLSFLSEFFLSIQGVVCWQWLSLNWFLQFTVCTYSSGDRYWNEHLMFTFATVITKLPDRRATLTFLRLTSSLDTVLEGFLFLLKWCKF